VERREQMPMVGEPLCRARVVLRRVSRCAALDGTNSVLDWRFRRVEGPGSAVEVAISEALTLRLLRPELGNEKGSFWRETHHHC
jgi:hypothetical protein